MYGAGGGGSIRASIIHADETIEERVLDHAYTLEEMQDIVGGCIQLVPGSAGCPGDVLCNEEGLLLELPQNKIASAIMRQSLVGTVLFLDYRID